MTGSERISDERLKEIAEMDVIFDDDIPQFTEKQLKEFKQTRQSGIFQHDAEEGNDVYQNRCRYTRCTQKIGSRMPGKELTIF